MALAKPAKQPAMTFIHTESTQPTSTGIVDESRVAEFSDLWFSSSAADCWRREFQEQMLT